MKVLMSFQVFAGVVINTLPQLKFFPPLASISHILPYEPKSSLSTSHIITESGNRCIPLIFSIQVAAASCSWEAGSTVITS